MRLYPFHPPSPVLRLSVRPDHRDPEAIIGRSGPRQPHTDAKVAAVRRLIEQTTLNYRQIAARTGVSAGSISNWKRDGGWKRPPFAPRACDTIPTPRATLKLKRRMLGARLQALAERHIRELEGWPSVISASWRRARAPNPSTRSSSARRWSFSIWRGLPLSRGAARNGGRARWNRWRRFARSRSFASAA